jgi:hypothetical protein
MAPSQTTTQNTVGTDATRLWERHRRWLVYLTFTIYWLMILEGGLRKWVFPGFGRYLYFIRDPFLFLVYLVAIQARIWPRKASLLTAGLLLSIGAMALTVLQSVHTGDQYSWLLAGFGWRMYFLYLPLPFLMAEYFQRADFDRLVRQTLLFAIPVALLVVAQYRSSPRAPINQGFRVSADQDDLGSINSANGDAVRTSGTFSSPLGQSYFSTSLVALLLGTWLLRPSRRPVKGLPLQLASIAAFLCNILSGSRATLLSSAIVFAIVGTALISLGRFKLVLASMFVLVCLVPVSLLTLNFMLPSALDNLAQHWETANENEKQYFGQFGVLSRGLHSFYAFAYLIPTAPTLGFGLGLGTNAVGAVTLDTLKKHGAAQAVQTWMPTSQVQLAGETGLARQIIDLGTVFGSLYIALRWAFVFWTGAIAFRAVRRSGEITPIIPFAFAANSMAAGLLTGNGTVSVYTWMFVGFGLAAARFAPSGVALRQVAAFPPPRRRRLVRPPRELAPAVPK